MTAARHHKAAWIIEAAWHWFRHDKTINNEQHLSVNGGGALKRGQRIGVGG